MKLSQEFTNQIYKIAEDLSKPSGAGSILWYYLRWYKKFEHQSDMNKLAGLREPKADALCLIVPTDYIRDSRILVIVYEHSELANSKYYPDGWHDDISMTKLKNMKYSQLHSEDREQTAAIVDCGHKFEFHLWRSPRRISAVTDRCKNFGDIWRNGVCIHEGNKYGDHEHFYVIGSMHWKTTRT